MLSSARLRTGRGICAVVLALAVVGLSAASPVTASGGDPLRSNQWSLDVIGEPSSAPTDHGTGVIVAVVDTGVDLSHEELSGRLVAGYDFVDDDRVPQDEHGHGTHVAGIVAAASANGRGISGVAPGARIMPIRVLDADGSGNSGDVVAGMRWAADNGADVVNLSLADFGRALAGSLFDADFSDGLNYLWSKGVVPVVAAGNESFFASGYAEEPALIITATDRGDAKASYASPIGSARWGMAAPGGGGGKTAETGVLSTYIKAGTPNAYAVLSGTSMAAPHVAGAAAVLLGFGRTPQQTVDVLQATAMDLGSPGRDSTFGAGRLDLAAALRAIGAPASRAAAPTPTPRPAATSRPAPGRTSPARPSTSAAPVTAAPTSAFPTSAAPTSAFPTGAAPGTTLDPVPSVVAPLPGQGSPASETAVAPVAPGPRSRNILLLATALLAWAVVAAAVLFTRRRQPALLRR